MVRQSHHKLVNHVRTRFAPSPTGTPESIHLGFVIRALWNYAYAKKNGGQFILRLEDTDQKRSRKDTEEEIYRVLRKFGFEWDEGPDVGGPHGPYRQSERLNKYKKAAMTLVECGFAYYDFDAPKREKEDIKAAYSVAEKLKTLKVRPKARLDNPDDAKKRVAAGEPYVIRIKIPEDKTFEYEDWILKKKISFLGKEVSDMILLKSDGYPTYHLAVVVDDVDMQISHVLRGQEWISSTPIHLHVYEGLGYEVPAIGHFTVILDPRTKKKFSKRDLTAMFGVNTWLNDGYLPEALLNFLMLLGWAPKDNKEVFSLDEFVEAFDQNGIQKANPIFNKEKLDWFNGYYIRQKSQDEFYDLLKPFLPKNADEKSVRYLIPLIQDRIKKLSDFGDFVGYVFKESKDIVPLKVTDNYEDHIQSALDALKNLDGDKWTLENINESLMNTIKEKGFKTGDFFMDMRGTIAGSRFTPPLSETLIPIGRKDTINRLERGLTHKERP